MIHRLEADGIELFLGTRKVLRDIHLACETTKVTGLLGLNGNGKTCLLNVIYGNLKAQSRSVRFDGHSVSKAYKRPDLLTYLPQFNFIPRQLTLARVFRDFGLNYTSFVRLLPEFENRERDKISSLSSGQKRLVEVYLIIKSRAQFSLLDEPFSQLMPLHIEKIIQLINEEKQSKGFVITDHLFQAVMDVSSSLYLLKDGKTHLVHNIEDLRRLGYVI